MSDLKERKLDGGLADLIEFYEEMGGEDDGEMLVLLLELRRHRINSGELEAAQQRADRTDAMLTEALESLKSAEAEIARRDLAAGVPVGTVTGYTVNGCVVSRSRLSIGDKVYSAAQPAVLPWHVDSCSNCGSKLMSWDTTVVKNTAVQDGLLKLNEVSGLFYLGCDECSETLLKVSACDVANHLNNAKAQGFTADGD